MCQDPRAKMTMFLSHNGSRTSLDFHDEQQNGSSVQFKGNDKFNLLDHFEHNEENI
jgi:hypothetical protein